MPRLAKLEKGQGDPQSQQLMNQLDAQKMLLNVFRGMANSPAVLDGYLKFSGALKTGMLSERTRTALALAVGQVNRCEYCLSVHHVGGKGTGLDEESIRDARLGQSEDPKTAAALTLARHLADSRGKVTDAQVAAAKGAGLSDGEIAEVVAHVALNIFTNYFNHVNQTEVDVPKVDLDIP